MNEPSSMKVSVSGASIRKSKVHQLVTVDRVIEWINNHQDLDDYTKDSLVDMVKRYPSAALPAFRRNFNLMLQRVRAKRKNDRNGEIYDQAEEIEQPAILNLDDAFREAFKPKEQGPELKIPRRPLFEEVEQADEIASEHIQTEEWEESGNEVDNADVFTTNADEYPAGE